MRALVWLCLFVGPIAAAQSLPVAPPLWFQGSTLSPAGQALLQELQKAEVRGLRPQDYDASKFAVELSGLPASMPAAYAAVQDLDRKMSLTIGRFVMDLHRGRINPREVGYDLDVTQAPLNVPEVLRTLAASDDVSAALDVLEPPFRHYRLLKKALARYRELAKAEEVRKIELTLERIRWLPPQLDSPPIIVNIPQFRLFAFRTTDDFAADILQMNVIVGAAFEERATPVFAADMRYIVLHPYWDVPMSIMRKEYLPLIRTKPRWVTDNGYEIVHGQTDAASVVEPTPENIERLAAGALRLRQKPGPGNALGIVKFMFPNRHNVYLHDTPAQALFKKSRRDFSHGCIRIADPSGLLAHVLREDADWPAERIAAALRSTEMLRIPLRNPIRVYILYATALATEAGETLFFGDIYEHDARLQTALDSRSNRLAQGLR